MAVTTILETRFGESHKIYVRVNSVSTNNHGAISSLLFRGYISREAFKDGGVFVWEKEIKAILDVSSPIWDQAYKHLKELDEFNESVDC